MTPVTVSKASDWLTQVTVLFTPIMTLMLSGEYCHVTGVSTMYTTEPRGGTWEAERLIEAMLHE